jgi:CDP-diacylglycerol--glycerol-3-phosphate 3-phosphatidyltransferase
MKTQNIQNKIDQIIDKVILWMIPEIIKPNYFTYLRIFLVPVIYLLLDKVNLELAFVLFVLAACTDFIDGALARTRGQITDLGKLIDPIADKMLILTALVYIGFDFLIVKVFVAVILFEITAVIIQALFLKFLERPIPANVFGKIKMVLQCFCVAIFFIGYILKMDNIITFSNYLLFIALIFAVISGIEQMTLAFLRVYHRHFKKNLLETKKEA